jgi:membrane fusion protein (multidrug efflux system)
MRRPLPVIGKQALWENSVMTKRMIIMLVCVGLLFGGIFGFQIFKMKMIKKFMSSMPVPPAAVTAMKVEYSPWQPRLNAIGTVRGVHGVEITSESAGVVREVDFKSGEEVQEGEILFQLNLDAEEAQLNALEAAASQARTLYERDKAQFNIQAISQAALDADSADLKSKKAQVAQQEAVIAKKTVRAPFSGRLGISTLSLGQYVNPGDKIVTLQALDPVYIDFSLPQQQLSRIELGQKIKLVADSYPDREFRGKVTAINPKIDIDTRNIQIEATVQNQKHELVPGMFVSVDLEAGKEERFLTLPQTAIAYNPYGETVFIVEESKGPEGKPILTVKQAFVKLGETRGDQVAILEGINPGERIVTSGQLKLRNGSPILINNKVEPGNNPDPKPLDR